MGDASLPFFVGLAMAVGSLAWRDALRSFEAPGSIVDQPSMFAGFGMVIVLGALVMHAP
jgi:hypothetical protein